MFTFQIFQNVGMTMGIMPITGIPLPFLSHGGSSTVVAFGVVGLVVNVSARRHLAKLIIKAPIIWKVASRAVSSALK